MIGKLVKELVEGSHFHLAGIEAYQWYPLASVRGSSNSPHPSTTSHPIPRPPAQNDCQKRRYPIPHASWQYPPRIPNRIFSLATPAMPHNRIRSPRPTLWGEAEGPVQCTYAYDRDGSSQEP